MTPAALHPFAQAAIERVLNSLPEGILIAFFAWAALRLLPKQNSRTRFAVWFVALVAIAILPWLPALLPNNATSDFAFPSASLTAVTMPSHWATVIFIAWILVATALIVRLATGIWRLHQLRQTCKPVDLADLDPSLCSLVAELSSQKSPLSRQVTLASSDHLHVPTAIGLWKPMIVLPSWGLRDLPASQLSIILRHEFAHLRHWDDWTNLFQKLVRVVFFFHPAVWWIEKRLSVEREMACDDVVVAETGNPTGYASCLVSLMERSLAQRGWVMAQAIVHRAREASMRLAQILDPQRPVATHISKPALGLLGTFTVLCLVMAPNSPQVISFEQSSRPAANEFSSVSAQLPKVPPSFIHNADLRSSSVRPLARPASLKTQTETHAFTSKAKVVKAVPKYRTELAANQSVSSDASAEKDPIRDSLADRSFLAAVSNVLFDESLFADQRALSGSPTFVIMQATEVVVPAARPDGTSRPLVWRVQIWRVSVVNATWKHRAIVPPAHST